MDEIRKKIKDAMERSGIGTRRLSRILGRNQAYISQYLNKGSPQRLDHDDALRVAYELGLNPVEIGVTPFVIGTPKANTGERAGSKPEAFSGFAEADAVPYVPGPDDIVFNAPHIAVLQMKTNALNQHPERIKPGDLLAFDINKTRPDDIRAGEVVYVPLYDKTELLTYHGAIVRQFLPPNKLVTNSSGDNEILSLDDERLPWEPVIKGTLLSVVRSLRR